MRLGLIVSFLVCLSAVAVYAAEFHVNWDGTGDFMAIQDAMDAAADSDVIVVHPGTYYENIHFDGKNIILRSLDPEEEDIVASTIIDGVGQGSVVTFEGSEDETCLLAGFSITNGRAEWGGGILGGDPWSDPPVCTLAAISNCTVSGSSASRYYGGGLWGCYGAISNCRIRANHASWGGGGLAGCGGTISSCTIAGNSASGFGGGLCYCDGTISNCTIRSNSATGILASGGGAYWCSATISNCAISGNKATGHGGGLDSCGGPISNCSITSNSATGEFVCGGGLSNCDGPICNCTITRNFASSQGGGLGGCSGTITDCTISANGAGECGGGLAYCHGTISNCTISANEARHHGGGLEWCEATISSCTITDNSAEYASGGGLSICGGTITNCAIRGNSAARNGGGLCGCSGTITNCTISANEAGEYGGGLYSYSYDGTISNCTISNCTIADNDAFSGGGMYLEKLHCRQVAVLNSVMWGDTPDEIAGATTYATVMYSDVNGGWTGTGNISDDPLFVSGTLGDYYLSCRAAGQAADSPCIDAGNGTAESLGLDKLTTRTDHVPDSGVADMGYHYPLTLDHNPQIECWLNSSLFWPGYLLVGFIEAHNPGPELVVDAYVAFVLPDGAIISLTSGGLTIGTYPWASNVMLLSGLDFGPSEVFRTTVPGGRGSYLFASALTEPGRFEFIGQPSLFPFTITD